MKDTGRTLFEVHITRMSKSRLAILLAAARDRLGENIDQEDITMDDVYSLAGELGFLGAPIDDLGSLGDPFDKIMRLVSAYTADQAREFVAQQEAKDDFSVLFSIEIFEATIFDA